MSNTDNMRYAAEQAAEKYAPALGLAEETVVDLFMNGYTINRAHNDQPFVSRPKPVVSENHDGLRVLGLWFDEIDREANDAGDVRPRRKRLGAWLRGSSRR